MSYKNIETLEGLEEAINAIDWDEIHIERLKYDRGNKLYLYYDAVNDIVETELYSQSSCPGKNDKSFGIFNCDCEIHSDYAEGWAKKNEECEYETEDGRTLSPLDMAIESIQYGDFSYTYEFWKQELINDFLRC